MRKVVLFIACSLDGYIAGANDEIDWLFADQDYGYSKFLETVKTILMGRRTWGLVNSFEDWPSSTHLCSIRQRRFPVLVLPFVPFGPFVVRYILTD